MSGMPQNLFGPSTVVNYGAQGTGVNLYSEVFDLTDATSFALRLRVYGILANTDITVQLETANDPLGADWEDLGSAATRDSAGCTEVYTGNSSGYEFAAFGRAKITVARDGAAGTGDYGGTFQAACMTRE